MANDLPKAPKDYFKLHLFALKLMGVYIGDFKNDFNRKIYSVYSAVFLTIIVYIYIITEAMDLIVNWGDLDNMTFNFCYLVTHFTGLCKTIVILMHRSSIKNYCQMVERGFFLPNFERGGITEFKIIQRAVKISNIQTYIFHCLVIVIVANRGFYAGFHNGYFNEHFDRKTNETIVTHVQVLPYTTWFPFDKDKSPFYEIGFTYQIVSCALYGLLVFTCDSLITSFMIHLKAQLLILKNSLRFYVQRAKLKFDPTYKKENDFESLEKLGPSLQKLIRKYLGECIHHHQDIIMLSEKVESEFHYLMLAQFLGSLLLMCFQLFQLSLYEVKSAKFFSMGCYLALMLFQLLMYCWHGNEVRIESLDVANAAYTSDWIVIDTQTQKFIIMMIQRANRPVKLTAGKFVYLTLETYVNILRASASYYMVLRRANL